MKRIITYILAIGILASCDDFIDVTPKGVVVPETVEHYQGLLNNARTTGSAPVSYAIASDDVYFDDARINSFDSWQFNAYSWADYYFNPEEIDFLWQQAYKEIADCNIIINEIDEAKGDELLKSYVKGEALVFRAFSYFQLANMYGSVYDKATADDDLAVPLLLEAQIIQQKPRASVQEIYDQIISDLDEAEKLMEEAEGQKSTNMNATKFHGDLNTVYALKMRVALFMEEYTDLINYGEKFFERLPIEAAILDYNTLPSPFMIIPLFNPEHFYFQLPSGPYDFLRGAYLSDDLVATFDKTKDLRLTYLAIPDGDKYLFNDYFSNIFPNPGFTTTEVLLGLAEGYIRNNEKNKAIDLINELQKRRHMTPLYTPVAYDDVNDAETLALVLSERRKELMYHGKRFFDLKRLGKDPQTAVTFKRTINGAEKEISPDDLRYQLAIPLDIMSMNDLLVQNPR